MTVLITIIDNTNNKSILDKLDKLFFLSNFTLFRLSDLNSTIPNSKWGINFIIQKRLQINTLEHIPTTHATD